MDIIKRIFHQASWQLLGKGVSVICGLIVLGLISRTYGREGTGIYTLSVTYISFFFLLADLGLNSYFLPKLKEDLRIANKLFNIRFFWGVLLMIFANAILPFLPFYSKDFSVAILVSAASIVFNGVMGSANLIFQSRLKYERSVFALSLGLIIEVPVVLFLVRNKVDVGLLAAGPMVAWFVSSVLALILVNKYSRFRIEGIDFNFFWANFKKAWPISLTLLLNIVYFRVDSFILSSVRNFSEVGIYNLGYQIFQTALVLPTFIMNGFYPLMIKSHQEDIKIFKKQIFSAFLLMFSLGFIGIIFTFIFANLIIKLISGPLFIDSAGVLKVLSLGFPAFFGSAVLMWVFITLKKYKTMLSVYITGLVTNLILNLVYIPKYSYTAASWVTVVSEYLILFLQMAILFRAIRYEFNN